MSHRVPVARQSGFSVHMARRRAALSSRCLAVQCWCLVWVPPKKVACHLGSCFKSTPAKFPVVHLDPHMGVAGLCLGWPLTLYAEARLVVVQCIVVLEDKLFSNLDSHRHLLIKVLNDSSAGNIYIIKYMSKMERKYPCAALQGPMRMIVLKKEV